jgi:hypothetical protein
MSPTERAAESATGQTVVERPPPGLARGTVAAPAGVVVALGTLIVLSGVATMTVRRLRRSKR